MANMTFSRRSRHFFCRSNWSASCNNAAAEIFDMAALLAAENRQQEHAETQCDLLGKIFRFFSCSLFWSQKGPQHNQVVWYIFFAVLCFTSKRQFRKQEVGRENLLKDAERGKVKTKTKQTNSGFPGFWLFLDIKFVYSKILVRDFRRGALKFLSLNKPDRNLRNCCSFQNRHSRQSSRGFF